MATNLLEMLSMRQMGSRQRVEERWIKDKWSQDTHLHRKDLLAHYGCVNAVEFSHDGDLMASGGDDKRILLWSVPRSLLCSPYSPDTLSAEHESNIFCLGFDKDKTRIYSGGNDAVVIVHDLATQKPVDVFRHDEPVYGVSIHPDNSDLFLTACSDGRVMLFDMRARPGEDPIMIAGYSHAFHAAQFNPVEPKLLVTANQKHGIGLWDVRRPMRRVMEYGGVSGQPSSCMYVQWNGKGDRILGIRRRLSPVLYSIDSPAAIAQFDHPGYYNSCTMKSCCFAGPDDEYVMSGSDDFNVYMWPVPGEGDTCPQWVSRARHVLSGHRSIVNQVRYNKTYSFLATSGVEKVVKVWSVLPVATADHDDTLTTGHDSGVTRERRVFSRDEYVGLVMRTAAELDYNVGSTEENPRMMAFFDSLVQREIQGSSDEESDSDHEEYNDTVISDDDDEDTAPRQSSQNIIADMIEKKRDQLRRRSLRKHQRRSGSSFTDPDAINKILQSARRVLGSDSSSQSSSSSSDSSDSSLLSLSSILRRASETEDSLSNDNDDTSSNFPDPTNNSRVDDESRRALQNLQASRRQLLSEDSSHGAGSSQSSSNLHSSVNKERSEGVSFKRNSKKRSLRQRSNSSEED